MSDTAEQARRWTKRMAPDGEGQVRGGWTAQDVQDGAQIMASLLAEYEAQEKRIAMLERALKAERAYARNNSGENSKERTEANKALTAQADKQENP